MKRALALAALLLVPVLAVLLASSGGLELGKPETLLERRGELRALAEARPVATFLAFSLAYVAAVSTALPVGPVMSLLAGFLFGRWLGTGTILVAATLGALVVFRVARSTVGTRLLRDRTAPFVRRAAEELRDNAFGYLVFMRLVPVFPFFLVNVLAGMLGVRAATFAAATLIGRIPATFVYVSLGEEASRIAAVGDLLSPRLALSLTGLGLLALLPVVLRHRRRRRAAPAPERT